MRFRVYISVQKTQCAYATNATSQGSEIATKIELLKVSPEFSGKFRARGWGYFRTCFGSSVLCLRICICISMLSEATLLPRIAYFRDSGNPKPPVTALRLVLVHWILRCGLPCWFRFSQTFVCVCVCESIDFSCCLSGVF